MQRVPGHIDSQIQSEGQAKLAAHLAERIVLAGRSALARCGKFTLALSPSVVNEALIEAIGRMRETSADVWNVTHVFWADTRFDSHDGKPANALALAAALPIPYQNLHLDVADDPDSVRAACAYEQELRSFFGCATDCVPQFDLVVLTLGSDGTLGGLIEGSPAATEIDRLAVASFDRKRACRYTTLTSPVLDHARELAVISDQATELQNIRTFRRSSCSTT